MATMNVSLPDPMKSWVEERTRELAEVNGKLLGQIGERLRAEHATAT